MLPEVSFGVVFAAAFSALAGTALAGVALTGAALAAFLVFFLAIELILL
jgi:hypothetical protein